MPKKIKVYHVDQKIYMKERDRLLEQSYECFKNAASQPDYNFPAPDPVIFFAWAEGIICQGLSFFVEDVDENRIVGGLALQRMGIPWAPNDQRVVLWTNPWFYIEPEYRKSSAAASLVKKAKSLADEDGAVLHITTMWQNRHEEKARFLEICGLEQVGGVFSDPARVKEQSSWETSSAAETTQLH